jgi:hypothetical protein
MYLLTKSPTRRYCGVIPWPCHAHQNREEVVYMVRTAFGVLSLLRGLLVTDHTGLCRFDLEVDKIQSVLVYDIMLMYTV